MHVARFRADAMGKFLISGMPIFITPGVVRLIFLLLASLPLASLLWKKIINSNPRLKILFLVMICLPFVLGPFYVVAVPRAQRHLSAREIDQLVNHFHRK